MVAEALALSWLLAKVVRTIPEPTRSIVLMALLGILLVGVLLIASTMLGASWVRKLGHVRRGPAVPPDLMIQRPTKPPAAGSQRPVPSDTTGDTQPSDETIT